MEKKQTILVMYSGGLDSLGMTYKLLTDPEYKDYALHIHHIHIVNVEGRDRAEAITVSIVMEELKKMGFKFDYDDSRIASRPYNQQYMYDTDSINFFAGYIASVNPHIKKIAMGMNATDANHSLEERRKRANQILQAFTPVEKIFPVMDMSKSEIYNSLPESLRDKFWSCRTPVYGETSITPCKKCHTCLELKRQGIKGY